MPANTILTPTMILREAGRLFHQKARVIPALNRKYDSRFAQTGAKVGDSITLRDRNRFTVTDGAVLNVQSVKETSQVLTIDSQKHIGMDFNSFDLTLKIDDFSERYIAPAVAQLVAKAEADIISRFRSKIWNFVDGDAQKMAFLYAAQAKQKLDEHLAPEDDSRTLILCPAHSTNYMDSVKGLFTPQGKLGAQYGDGEVKDALGFSISQTTQLAPVHQTGTAVATTLYTVNGATEGADGLVTLQTGTTTFLTGDIVTFAGCYEVHPETGDAYSYLKQFVVTADFAGGAGDLHISPSIVTSGAKKNASAYPDNNGAVVKLGCTTVASATYVESLAFHKDAGIVAFVDLEDMSKYGAWGAREEMDGISMRIWRQGDIVNDSAPCRLDICYGFLARYPQLACRIHADG